MSKIYLKNGKPLQDLILFKSLSNSEKVRLLKYDISLIEEYNDKYSLNYDFRRILELIEEDEYKNYLKENMTKEELFLFELTELFHNKREGFPERTKLFTLEQFREAKEKLDTNSFYEVLDFLEEERIELMSGEEKRIERIKYYFKDFKDSEILINNFIESGISSDKLIEQDKKFREVFINSYDNITTERVINAHKIGIDKILEKRKELGDTNSLTYVMITFEEEEYLGTLSEEEKRFYSFSKNLHSNNFNSLEDEEQKLILDNFKTYEEVLERLKELGSNSVKAVVKDLSYFEGKEILEKDEEYKNLLGDNYMKRDRSQRAFFQKYSIEELERTKEEIEIEFNLDSSNLNNLFYFLKGREEILEYYGGNEEMTKNYMLLDYLLSKNFNSLQEIVKDRLCSKTDFVREIIEEYRRTWNDFLIRDMYKERYGKDIKKDLGYSDKELEENGILDLFYEYSYKFFDINIYIQNDLLNKIHEIGIEEIKKAKDISGLNKLSLVLKYIEEGEKEKTEEELFFEENKEKYEQFSKELVNSFNVLSDERKRVLLESFKDVNELKEYMKEHDLNTTTGILDRLYIDEMAEKGEEGFDEIMHYMFGKSYYNIKEEDGEYMEIIKKYNLKPEYIRHIKDEVVGTSSLKKALRYIQEEEEFKSMSDEEKEIEQKKEEINKIFGASVVSTFRKLDELIKEYELSEIIEMKEYLNTSSVSLTYTMLKRKELYDGIDDFIGVKESFTEEFGTNFSALLEETKAKIIKNYSLDFLKEKREELGINNISRLIKEIEKTEKESSYDKLNNQFGFKFVSIGKEKKEFFLDYGDKEFLINFINDNGLNDDLIYAYYILMNGLEKSIKGGLYYTECGHSIELLDELLRSRIIKGKQGEELCTVCNKKRGLLTSEGEKEVLYFIKSIYSGEIIENDRCLVQDQNNFKKEIDIHLHQIDLGVEYDGLYWHDEKEDKYKDYLAIRQGIKLIRISEEDWNKDKNKCKDMLREQIIKRAREKGFKHLLIIK